MTRIDRYIVTEFGRVFLICFITFLGLFIVADFVNNLDELVKHAKTHGGLPNVLLSFYGPKVPGFFDLIGRIVALVAAIFAITSLQRNNEMASMMAAGISRWRIIKPVVASVAFVALLGVLNRELLIPQFSDTMGRDARNFAGDQTGTVRARHDHATDIFFDGEGIRAAPPEIDQPSFGLPAELAVRGTRLEAELARYYPADGDRPAGFLLSGVTSPKDIAKRSSLYLGDKPVVYSPRDNRWLKQDQAFVPTGLPFAHLQSGNQSRQYASTYELITGARNPSLDYGAEVSVAIHARMLQPLLDMTLLFLGIPVVLARESQNVFKAVGSCIFLITLFVIVSLGFHGLGVSYLLRPSLAVWMPLMIFVPIAALMSEPLRK